MKRAITFLLFTLFVMSMSAYDFKSGNFYYNITSSNTIEVTNGDTKYSGNVVIPSSVTYNDITYAVTSIGGNAFYNCISLTSVTIPNSVTSIGSYAFIYCTSLTSVTIPSSVTSIGDWAFSGTPWWNNLPQGEYYAGKVFLKYKSVSGVTSVVIKEGTTAIYPDAFRDCSSLTSVTIPNSVMSIGGYAFYNCSSLTSVTIPNSVTSIGRNAFYNCSSLTSVTIPNSVMSIGSDAFNYTGIYKNNSNWENGVLYISNCLVDAKESLSGAYAIKNGTRIIADYAFNNCTFLTSVTIPNSVTSIGSNAFSSCSSLTSVTIPNSVTSIGNSAFSGCVLPKDKFINNSACTSDNNWGVTLADKEQDGLLIKDNVVVGCKKDITTATIPNGIVGIGDYAFEYCSSLTSVTIPNSVTSIGNGAFEYCSSLTSVTIPNSVTSIEGSTFSSCSSLTSVTIPNSVTSIGSSAFSSCSSLTSVTIPNSVTSIGNSAFSSCFLTSISLPESVTSIGDRAFEHCYGFDTIYANKMTPPSIGEGVFTESSPVCYVPCGAKAAYEASDWASQVRKFVELCEEKYTTLTYTSTDGNIVIPSYNDAFDANIVGNTYENGEGAIIFDGPVTTIGYHAFTGCRTLASINIPNTVTSIGEYAFGFCTNLTELRIPKSVTTLGADENGIGIVYQAPNLQRIIVEEGNPVYDSRNNCNAIIETTTNTLLSGCKNTSIPSGIKTIGVFAFCGCADLQTIEIPTSVKTIKQGAFYETGLTRFIIPSNVTLEDATYQNTQTILGGIFAGCEQLTEVVIPEGTTRIASGMLAGCSSLESLTIPASVTSIGKWAFYDCDALTSITIPNGVTSIEEGTFMRCSKLTSITIPSGVTNIGYYAFGECILLSSITCEATTPPMLEDLKGSPVFTSSPICYIPCGTKAAYEASDWAQYVSEFVEDCDNGFYSRNVRIGYNTICLPHGSSNFTGATFYEIAHILKNKKKIFFDEVKTLEAGKPYIFYPHSNEVTVYYDNTTSAVPLSHNGLHGTFDGITAASNFLKGKYLVAGDRMVLCGDGCSLAANRAYIELDEISDKDHPAIPGIKRVSMDYSEENATTALDNITDETIVAPMQEGVYDILGRKVDAPTVSGFYIINGKKVFVK